MMTISRLLCCRPTLRRLGRCAEGQDLVEYAMLAALVSLIAIGAVTAVGASVNTMLWAPAAAAF